MRMTMDDVVKKLEPRVREIVERAREDERAKLRGQRSRIVEHMAGMATHQHEVKGADVLGGIAVALAAGGGDRQAAVAYAEKIGASAVVKALAAGLDTAGGFLIPEEVANEVIELLRAHSTVVRLKPLSLPLHGNALKLPRLDQGANASWIGENANAPATQPKFGQVVLTPHKLAALVPVSNDLIRRAPLNASQIVSMDIVASTAATVDLAYLRADGAGGQPLGLLNQPGVQKFNSSGTTLDDMTADLGLAIQKMMDANVRMIRPGWIMAPRTWKALITARSTTGQLVFKPEMDRGTLFGFPFAISSQIPTNLGAGSDESELYFADFADIVIGEALPVAIDVSAEAAYQDGANLVSAFSLDQTVVRAIVETDLGLRHPESVVIVQALTWS